MTGIAGCSESLRRSSRLLTSTLSGSNWTANTGTVSGARERSETATAGSGEFFVFASLQLSGEILPALRDAEGVGDDP